MRTGPVLTIEVKDSPLDVVTLFTLNYELLHDSIYTDG